MHSFRHERFIFRKLIYFILSNTSIMRYTYIMRINRILPDIQKKPSRRIFFRSHLSKWKIIWKNKDQKHETNIKLKLYEKRQ